VASTSFPSGSPRTVDDNQFEILAAAWASDGIIGAIGDSTFVFADSSGRQVKIRAGKYAQVHGRGYYSGTTDIITTVTANASGQPRIDLVVLGLDRSTWAVTAYVKAGTPALTPSPPSLQRDAAGAGTGKWEIPLAYVNVANGASNLAASDVTAIPAFVGGQPWNVPDLTTLGRMPTPAAGQLAVVVDQIYVYTTANGWRRHDWYCPWGVIGGKAYTANSAVMAAGIGTTQTAAGMDSGTVTTVAGRRYRLKCFFFTSTSVQNSPNYRIQLTNVSGAVYSSYVPPIMIAGYGYAFEITGEYDETVSGTKTFILSASTNTGSGTITISRGFTDTNRTYLEVEDIGPSGTVSFPN
jgi:hypothetical protein